jgi:(R,R)-butanediol dehydrogenase/meso-butanediol dehydrogenase/diacetyl reductase
MKALRWHAVRDVRLDEVTEPSPGEGEVKVKVRWCGVCGGDVNAYEVGSPIIPTQRPHPRTGKMAPVVLGHEFSGDVVELGTGVSGINIGDRVTVRPTLVCYNCHWCKKGQYVQCATLATIGLGADGAFAPYVVVPSDCIYPISEKLSYEVAAFCEPLAVGIHACKRGGVGPGNTVAIVGAGPIGLLVLQAVKAAGATKIFVIEPLPNRRQLAKDFGATEVLDPQSVDVGKEIAKLTNKLRVDVSLECAGPPAAMLTAAKICQRGGRIVQVGVWEKPYEFPFADLWMREQTVITSQGYADEFPVAIAFLSDGRVNIEPMISAKIKLDDIIERAFKELISGRRADYIKILVSPE